MDRESWGTSDIGRLWESSECHEISIVLGQSRESAWVALGWVGEDKDV